MSQPVIIKHPVAQHKLTILRNKATTFTTFRRLMEEVSQLLAYEVTRDLETKTVDVETPLAKTQGHWVSREVVLVPIMRAGNAMLDGMMNLLSFASVGHIGIYRDKFIKNTVEYFFRMPDQVAGKTVILLDPLLATGDTAVAAISRLKEYDVGEIRFVTVLASEVGLKKLQELHPDVQVYTLSVEPELNSDDYILPGIGDAGDRIYGTLGQ